MKKVKTISCWTDYPFESLGDSPHETAPIRQVEVIYYDGDKYASVIVEGQEESIKTGYLYNKPVRMQSGKWYKKYRINPRKFERMNSRM